MFVDMARHGKSGSDSVESIPPQAVSNRLMLFTFGARIIILIVIAFVVPNREILLFETLDRTCMLNLRTKLSL